MSLDRLAAKIAAVPLNGRGHRRYPDSLKREITAAHASSGMTLIMDRGYRGQNARNAAEREGLVYRAPPRDREDPYAVLDVPLTKEEKRILTRYSYRKANYDAIVKFACCLMWWRRIERSGLSVERMR